MRSSLSYIALGVALALIAGCVTGPALLEEPVAGAVTPYGAVLTLACLAGVLCLAMQQRKRGTVLPEAARAGAVCIVLGLACGRLLYVLIRLPYYKEIGLLHMLALREGGFLLPGAVIGLLLGAACLSRRGMVRSVSAGIDGPTVTLHREKRPYLRALDELTVPALLTLAIARLAEGLAGEGLGDWIEQEALCRFPFAAQNVYGEYQWAVFVLEALAALVILIACLRLPLGEGKRARRGFTCLACSQIVLESLRADSVLKIGFVRVTQVACAVLILTLTALAARRGGGKRIALRVIAFGLLTAAVGGLEWALDKTTVPPAFLYAAMTLCVIGMGVNAQVALPHHVRQ